MEYQNKKEFLLQKPMILDTYVFVNEIDNFSLIDKLVEISRKDLPNSPISTMTNVKARRTDFNSLKFCQEFHEFLKIIRKDIFKIYPANFSINSAWANFYGNTKMDHAQEHNHVGVSAFCGILYCTDGPGPGTHFKQYDLNIEEKKGRFVLFHPLLLHSVSKFNYESERITIAFNMDEVKSWDYSNNSIYKINNKINL